MSGLTIAIYVLLVGCVAGILTDKIQVDIALVLLVLLVITFAYWLLNKCYVAPKTIAQAKKIEAQMREQSVGMSEEEFNKKLAAVQSSVLREPWWIEWTAGFFWVIFIVFTLRSFVIEPFRIPSGSMKPTLETGDFILVNKYTYGISLPVLNKKIIELNKPKKGDVIVFRWPVDEKINYIKRVVGEPGDMVIYKNKQLIINGQPVPHTLVGEYKDSESLSIIPQFQETLGGIPHQVAFNPRPSYRSDIVNNTKYFVKDFPYSENCHYDIDNFECKVPQGYYFVLGDNRDNSVDSRYWGFVPEGNVVGKAFFIWANFSEMGRIGSFD